MKWNGADTWQLHLNSPVANRQKPKEWLREPVKWTGFDGSSYSRLVPGTSNCVNRAIKTQNKIKNTTAL